MNFLQLCRRACVECGVASDRAIQLALPTVVDASGSLGRVVNWVGDAWNDLQMQHDDWDWMRSSNILGSGVSFRTFDRQASYPLGAAVVPSGSDFTSDFGSDFGGGPGGSGVGVGDFTSDFSSDFGTGQLVGTVGVLADAFGKWDRETFRCFPTATGYRGEGFLGEVSYDYWRDCYMFGAMRDAPTRPIVIAVGPDQSLCLGPPPTGLYTVSGDYFVAPSVMVADTDVPAGLPVRFQMLIVYLAMQKYGGYESAPEVFQRGASEAGRMLAQLMVLHAPRISFAGALA